jgi:predicted GTPase
MKQKTYTVQFDEVNQKKVEKIEAFISNKNHSAALRFALDCAVGFIERMKGKK